MALALLSLGQGDKANNITKEGEELLNSLPKELPIKYKQREASIAFLKGWIHHIAGDNDQAIEQFELSFSLREQLGIKQDYSPYGI